MITPIVNHLYEIRHSGKVIIAQCLEIVRKDGFKSLHSNYQRNAVTRYHFKNLNTGRNIVVKSRVKILKEKI